MIANKRLPVLRSETRRARLVLHGPVGSNRPRRNADTELQPELIGDPLFAPSRIFMNHSRDHLLEFDRQLRTPDGTRLSLPKQSERIAMPADQRCRLNNEKSGFPVKEAGRPEDQRQASYIRQPSGLDPVFMVEGQLLAEKQILGNQRGSRVEALKGDRKRGPSSRLVAPPYFLFPEIRRNESTSVSRTFPAAIQCVEKWPQPNQ